MTTDRKKSEKYKRIVKQLNSILRQTNDSICRMSTINAILHHKMPGFFWTGFYLLRDGELIAGPYQGQLACQVLEKNKGVCWTAINKGETIVVDDVDKFPGHIACNPKSKSEIAVPLKNRSAEIIGVLDIDGIIKGQFDTVDAFYLEEIVKLYNI